MRNTLPRLACNDLLGRDWQKPHEPNLTGTDFAYRPPGHTLSTGEKPKPPYEAWRPG